MDEYINKAELVGNLDRFAPEQLTPLIRTLIEKQPTADVVEVVRCKDCVYRVPINEQQFSYKGKPAMHCVIHSRLRSENDYCSYGERRETDAE